MDDDAITEDEEPWEFELEPVVELVALRLAAGASQAEAAMSIGRQAKWVQRRLAADPLLRRRVADLKRERVSRAAARLGSLLDRVFDMAERNLDAPRPADQIAAGRLLLDRERIYTNATDTAEDIEELKNEIVELRALIAQANANANTNPHRGDAR